MVDAWGQARSDQMTEAHVREHRNLCTGLISGPVSSDADEASTTIFALLDSMLEHMDHEERIFLASDILTDDIRIGDAFGG